MAVTYFGFSSLGRSENLVDLKPLLPCTLTGLGNKKDIAPYFNDIIGEPVKNVLAEFVR